MKTKAKLLSITMLLCIAALTSSGQNPFTPYSSVPYGGGVAPNTVHYGPYANKAAIFDSVGTLDIGGTCSTCPAPITVYSKTVTLTSAQVNALYTTPDTIISAAGRSITINIINAYATLNYNSAAYTADSILYLNIGAINVASNNGALHASSSYGGIFDIENNQNATSNPSTHISLQSNQGLVITTATSNPATGNSTLTITVVYSFLNLGSN